MWVKVPVLSDTGINYVPSTWQQKKAGRHFDNTDSPYRYPAMTSTMTLKVGVLLCLLSAISAFAPAVIQRTPLQFPSRRHAGNVILSEDVSLKMRIDDIGSDDKSVSISEKDGNKFHNLKAVAMFSSLSAAFISTVGPAFADSSMDDIEIAELPPPYIPIIFAIAIIAGVGLLTASLGDVMKEEASLGLQSGARAKKERERSRSSYFKNK